MILDIEQFMTKLRTRRYRLLLKLHEIRCTEGLYNVYEGDLGVLVIHDPCGHLWSSR